MKQWFVLGGAFVGLLLIVWLNIRPYHGNITIFFHNDDLLLRSDPPKNTVILQEPAYDGMQYYMMARVMPSLFSPSKWSQIAGHDPGPYAWQRVLLPFTAFALAAGQTRALPWSFLTLEILSLLAAGFLLLRRGIPWIFALALIFSPAAMIGLHFSLAEPLSIALMTAFLLQFREDGETLSWRSVLLLSLLGLAREVHLLLFFFLCLFLLCTKRWKNGFWMIIPIGVFCLWHGIIFLIFHQIPFLMSSAKNTLPFAAILPLFGNLTHPDAKTLSSLALFFGFVLPQSFFVTRALSRGELNSLVTGTSFFLMIMICMPSIIWSSITSIGRVITPVYPFAILMLAQKPGKLEYGAGIIIALLGICTAIGLALIIHPFTLT